METEFGGHRAALCPNVLINRTNFAFYSIKIRLETLEIIFFNVALLSQAKNLSIALINQAPALLVKMSRIKGMPEPLPETRAITN